MYKIFILLNSDNSALHFLRSFVNFFKVRINRQNIYIKYFGGFKRLLHL